MVSIVVCMVLSMAMVPCCVWVHMGPYFEGNGIWYHRFLWTSMANVFMNMVYGKLKGREKRVFEEVAVAEKKGSERVECIMDGGCEFPAVPCLPVSPVEQEKPTADLDFDSEEREWIEEEEQRQGRERRIDDFMWEYGDEDEDGQEICLEPCIASSESGGRAAERNMNRVEVWEESEEQSEEEWSDEGSDEAAEDVICEEGLLGTMSTSRFFQEIERGNVLLEKRTREDSVIGMEEMCEEEGVEFVAFDVAERREKKKKPRKVLKSHIIATLIPRIPNKPLKKCLLVRLALEGSLVFCLFQLIAF
jgi:hypothetical protein